MRPKVILPIAIIIIEMTSNIGIIDCLGKTKMERIDGLINNAGLITKERRLTKEGTEMMFGVNHLGTFLLTALLLEPMLNQKSPARIVYVNTDTIFREYIFIVLLIWVKVDKPCEDNAEILFIYPTLWKAMMYFLVEHSSSSLLQ